MPILCQIITCRYARSGCSLRRNITKVLLYGIGDRSVHSLSGSAVLHRSLHVRITQVCGDSIGRSARYLRGSAAHSLSGSAVLHRSLHVRIIQVCGDSIGRSARYLRVYPTRSLSGSAVVHRSLRVRITQVCGGSICRSARSLSKRITQIRRCRCAIQAVCAGKLLILRAFLCSSGILCIGEIVPLIFR